MVEPLGEARALAVHALNMDAELDVSGQEMRMIRFR